MSVWVASHGPKTLGFGILEAIGVNVSVNGLSLFVGPVMGRRPVQCQLGLAPAPSATPYKDKQV